MDNREGKQPESMKPQPGQPPAKAEQTRNGAGSEAVRSGPTSASEIPAIADAEEQTGFFTMTNIVMVGLLLALLCFLLYKFTFDELLNIVKAALGLSFVIFIHELGHFLAAKWCDVNVTTFSIGFGPPIPGCQFTWGETNYRLAILPLGGYVQMVGQIDGDESSDGSDDDPRSYRRKTVGQRMLIISAGVIMNAILAACCFIAVYQGPGKEAAAAVVGNVDSGGPGFTHGLRTGAVINRIGSVDNPTFPDLMQTVINSLAGQKIPLDFQRPGEPVVSIEIEPRKDKGVDTKPVIGLLSPSKLRFINKIGTRPGPYLAGTPAALAKFQFGDVIIGMTDPDDPAQAKEYRADRVTDLPDDPRFPHQGQRDYFEFARRLQLLADKEIVVRVQRGTEANTEEVNVTVAPMFRVDHGARMQMGPILAVREKSPADTKVRCADTANHLEADLIEAVSVTDADGKILEWKDKNLDPERLPHQLRQWSDRLDRADKLNTANRTGEAKAERSRMVTLQLRRHQVPAGKQFASVKEEVQWDTSWRFDRVVPFSRNSPMAIPELGLAYQIKAIVVDVPGKESQLKVGDVIKNVRYDVDEFDKDIEGKWMKKDIEEGQWAHVSFVIFDQQRHYKKIVFKVERVVDREKKIVEVEIPLNVDKTWALEDRGWILASDTRRVKADNTAQAIWLGFKDTNNRMIEVFLNLRGMIFGRIDTENIGGPLLIAEATYRFAGMDFADFTFFLGLISINLAVVNFLPIPVLDGGHMVFLIYEKIRGQPASEGVRIGATYVGLATILCLMIFVLYLDVSRLFF